MSKNHDEARAAILFKAAADLYKLAASMDPATEQPWIDQTDLMGRKVEDMGHEQVIATTQQERRLGRLRASIKTTRNQELKARILAKALKPRDEAQL